MACAIAGITVNPLNARFYLPLAKPNHLWVTLEYLTGSQEVMDLYPLFSRVEYNVLQSQGANYISFRDIFNRIK